MELQSKSESTTVDLQDGIKPALGDVALDIKIDSESKEQPKPAEEEYHGPKRDFRFWLVFVALCCSLFLSSLDLGGVGMFLPWIWAVLIFHGDYQERLLRPLFMNWLGTTLAGLALHTLLAPHRVYH